MITNSNELLIILPAGACGFGEFGKTVNNGEVAGVSRLYSGGSGCGACYLVRQFLL